MKKVVVLLFLVSSVYVTGVHSAFGISGNIPGLIEGITPAIGKGIAPLVAVNVSVNENLAMDSTGGLDLVQKIIGNVSEPLNTLLNQLLEDSSSNSVQIGGMQTRVNELITATCLAFGFQSQMLNAFNKPDIASAKKYAAQLSTKLSPSVSSGITKAISDLIDSSISDTESPDTFTGAYNLFSKAVEKASNNMALTPLAISNYVTPDHVIGFTSTTANVVSGVAKLATALQLAVLELVPKTVDPVIATKLPNIVPQLLSFNASADNTRHSLRQTGKSLAKDATSAYSSVTSNPWNWNDGNIANLTKFLANFTALVQNNFTQSFDSGIDSMKRNISATLTNKVNQLAQVLNNVYTNISDSNTKSSSMFKASCVANYNASLLALPAAISRLGNCIQLEDGALGVINSQATEAIRKAKDDATKAMNQLHLCNEQNIACTKVIFASFENRYQDAATALTLTSNYTVSGLQLVASRVSDCITALSAEIESQAQTLRVNFNGCLAYGFWRWFGIYQFEAK